MKSVNVSLMIFQLAGSAVYLSIPFINDFMLAVNTEEIRAAQIDMIYRSLEAYILGEDYPNGQIVELTDDVRGAAYGDVVALGITEYAARARHYRVLGRNGFDIIILYGEITELEIDLITTYRPADDAARVPSTRNGRVFSSARTRCATVCGTIENFKIEVLREFADNAARNIGGNGNAL